MVARRFGLVIAILKQVGSGMDVSVLRAVERGWRVVERTFGLRVLSLDRVTIGCTLDGVDDESDQALIVC